MPHGPLYQAVNQLRRACSDKPPSSMLKKEFHCHCYPMGFIKTFLLWLLPSLVTAKAQLMLMLMHGQLSTPWENDISKTFQTLVVMLVPGGAEPFVQWNTPFGIPRLECTLLHGLWGHSLDILTHSWEILITKQQQPIQISSAHVEARY